MAGGRPSQYRRPLCLARGVFAGNAPIRLRMSSKIQTSARWESEIHTLKVADVALCNLVISPVEKDRMREFRFERDRDSYRAGHALTRCDAAVPPHAWVFEETSHGRPEISGATDTERPMPFLSLLDAQRGIRESARPRHVAGVRALQGSPRLLAHSDEWHFEQWSPTPMHTLATAIRAHGPVYLIRHYDLPHTSPKFKCRLDQHEHKSTKSLL